MRLSATIVVIALAALSALLAGCAGDAAVRGGPSAARGGVPEPMGGRWQLALAGSIPCVMNFGGSPSDLEGTIAPEGGCPGSFYTSRKWTSEQGSIVIRDHNGQPLGQLTLAAPGRFEGKANSGQPLTLTR